MITQLDTKSVYTFMDSLVSIRDYIQRAKEMGYQQIGLMDIDNLYGAYEFFRRVSKKLVWGAVLGLDLEVELPVGPLSIRLIALGTKGYKHLIKISSMKMMGTTDWSAFQHFF